MSILRIIVAIIIYLIVISIILFAKPELMFSADTHKMLQFGAGENETIFSPVAMFPIIAIVSLYIGAWIEMMI